MKASSPSSGGERAVDSRYLRLVLAAVLLAGAALRLIHAFDVPVRSPDERVYTQYAWMIAENGIAGEREQVERYCTNPGEWPYPPPIRIGYLWLVSTAMRLSGTSDESVGAGVSLASSILWLGLLASTGWRYFGPKVAVVAVCLAAVSIPDLVMARRAWQDSSVGLFGFALMPVAFEVVECGGPLWLSLYGALGAMNVLMKDSSGLLTFGFWTAWAVGAGWRRRRGLPSLVLRAAGVGVCVAAVTLVVVIGGADPVWTAFQRWSGALSSNAYALEYASGSAVRFVAGVFCLAPLATLLFLVGVAALLREGVLALPGRALAAVVFPLLWLGAVLCAPHLQVARYLSPAFGALYLVAAIGFWAVADCGVRALPGRAGLGLLWCMVGLLALSCLHDWLAFEHRFVARNVMDLSIKSVMDAFGP